MRKVGDDLLIATFFSLSLSKTYVAYGDNIPIVKDALISSTLLIIMSAVLSISKVFVPAVKDKNSIHPRREIGAVAIRLSYYACVSPLVQASVKRPAPLSSPTPHFA